MEGEEKARNGVLKNSSVRPFRGGGRTAEETEEGKPKKRGRNMASRSRRERVFQGGGRGRPVPARPTGQAQEEAQPVATLVKMEVTGALTPNCFV